MVRVAMKTTFKTVMNWREANSVKNDHNYDQTKVAGNVRRKWDPSEFGCFKVNVDASSFLGAATFSVRMALRDHNKLVYRRQDPCISLPYDCT